MAAILIPSLNQSGIQMAFKYLIILLLDDNGLCI